MVSGEEHQRLVMEGNTEYLSGYLLPSTTSLRCSSPVTVVTSRTTVCACERAPLSQGTNCRSGCYHDNRRRTPQRSRGRYNRYPDRCLLPSTTSLRCSSPVTVVTSRTTVCACERALFHREQSVIRDVTMVSGEEHLREVVEGKRYPDRCLLPSTTSLRCSSPVTWSHPERQFVPCERGTLSHAQTVVRDVTMVTGEEHLRSRGR